MARPLGSQDIDHTLTDIVWIHGFINTTMVVSIGGGLFPDHSAQNNYFPLLVLVLSLPRCR